MQKVTEILLVEDNEVDVWITEETLRESGLHARLHVVNDGEEAIHFLKKAKAFERAITPDLIFLDLNLPKKDGIEVLREIKADSSLRDIPVVILTTSSLDRDVEATFDCQASAYLNKPVDANELVNIIQYQYLFKPSLGNS